MKRTVLIVTRAYDPHVPPVTETIRARGADVLCFNLADFPETVSLQATLDTQQERWAGSIISHSGHIPLDALTSIWWRRPTSYKAPATYSPGERTFLEEEANRGSSASWRAWGSSRRCESVVCNWPLPSS